MTQLNTWNVLNDKIISALEDMKFKQWTPIQKKVLPILLNNELDIIALAQTGTGKTAAYGLPLLSKTINNQIHTYSEKKLPTALIISPTRELCIQIANDISSYAKYLDNISVLAVYGGTDIVEQLKSIKHGIDIIVATPGRFLDILRRHSSKMSKISTIVIDEADKLFNMGFLDETKDILKNTPKNKNIWLFSATMPEDLNSTIMQFLNNPKWITAGTKNSISDNINNLYFVVHAKDKILALERICDYYPDMYAIIFCNTRQITQEITDKLVKDGYKVDALHGDLTQEQRHTVMIKFRSHVVNLIVATDVAARGIDIQSLTHVINFNIPDDVEQYIHRSGRTGRANCHGTAISIINIKEQFKIHNISKTGNIQFSQCNIPSGSEICQRQLFYMADKLIDSNNNIDQHNSYILKKFADLFVNTFNEHTKDDIIKRIVSVELNRLFETYRNSDDLNIENLTELTEKERINIEQSNIVIDNAIANSNNGFVKVSINLGHKTGTVPARIISLINDTVRHKVKIGKIEIFDTYSIIEVEISCIDMIIKSFDNRNDDRYKITPISQK